LFYSYLKFTWTASHDISPAFLQLCWNNEAVKGIFGSAFKLITSQFLWQQVFHEKLTALRDSALHIQHRNDHENKNYKKLMKNVSRNMEGQTLELY